MNQSRTTGLLLLATGALTFLGTTHQLLPAVTFFPGLAACLLGLLVFMKANRVALAESEKRRLRSLNPEIRSSSADAAAQTQAETDGASLAALESREDRAALQAAPGQPVRQDDPALRGAPPSRPGDAAGAGRPGESEPDDADFVVATDVSFPLEIQQQSSLADQIAKLRRLADDGILSEEEFAVAKAKLLD